MAGQLAPEDLERFWSKVKQDGECWSWTGAKNVDGYGRWRPPKSTGFGMWLSHRIAYHYMVSAIPEGLELDHLCRNRGCVNPWHLEAVTRLENVRRAYRGMTHCKHGHPYTPENCYVWPNGQRRCRICASEGTRRLRAAARAAAEHAPNSLPVSSSSPHVEVDGHREAAAPTSPPGTPAPDPPTRTARPHGLGTGASHPTTKEYPR